MTTQKEMLDDWRACLADYENLIRQRAGYTRRMISELGDVETIERLVRGGMSSGFATLFEKKRLDLSAEAVVLRHPEHFSSEAQAAAAARLEDSNKGGPTSARSP